MNKAVVILLGAVLALVGSRNSPASAAGAGAAPSVSAESTIYEDTAVRVLYRTLAEPAQGAEPRSVSRSRREGEFNDIFSVGKIGASDDAKSAADALKDSFRNDHRSGSSPIGATDTYDSSRYVKVGSGDALSRAVAASPHM